LAREAAQSTSEYQPDRGLPHCSRTLARGGYRDRAPWTPRCPHRRWVGGARIREL